MYRDYALSPDLFHWESQSTTSVASPAGQRYLRRARSDLGTAPYIFLGPADYVSHTGDPPVAITWRLHRPMPTEVYLAARAAVA